MFADSRPLAIFLMGPTASGKTALALDLATRFDLGLISVDSALVYRGLDIGTAKPDQDTLRRFPHRLIDIREPNEPYSAADFRADALREIQTVHAAGKIPLLVGGTGLYFRALQRGLSDLPEADAEVRFAIASEAEQIGWAALHARLTQRDPLAATRIKPNDSQRIQRALEVIALTGQSLSSQQSAMPSTFPYRVLKLVLLPENRSWLHERIAQRFEIMLQQGFLVEVERLRARTDVSCELPALRAVGYRQAWQYLDGIGDAQTFRERAIFATRQLAKRQITWLRSELDARRLAAEQSAISGIAQRAVSAFLYGLTY